MFIPLKMVLIGIDPYPNKPQPLPISASIRAVGQLDGEGQQSTFALCFRHQILSFFQGLNRDLMGFHRKILMKQW